MDKGWFKGRKHVPWHAHWGHAASFQLLVLLSFLMGAGTALGQKSNASPVQVIAIQGTNWWLAPSGAADWVLASTRMPQSVRTGDRIRTGRATRLFLQTPNLGVVQIPPLTTIEISPPPDQAKSIWFRIGSGMMYLFHRGSPTDVEVHTRGASAAVRGTEFVAEAREDGGLIIRLVDGLVELRNDQGTVLLQGGDEGVAAAGQRPARTASIQAINAIQWCLYYPAIIDPAELGLTTDERASLADSLAAYAEGDLMEALARYPAGREPPSPAERVYRAALWLAIGQVAECESVLAQMNGGQNAAGSDPSDRLATALRRMIAAVRGQSRTEALSLTPATAGEWLAESYYHQAQGQLSEARQAARHATVQAPGFGFGWARLAEVEFGFGRLDAADEALDRALALAPRHAAAVTLRGFQLAARNRIKEAHGTFERALALDPGLGDAWLGRGLCQIRRGRLREGLEDLEVAAAMEPQRALLRSYLAKAFATDGDIARAAKELALAKTMDPGDPTAWLYSALLHQQEGRINEGIQDLERSKELNDHRQIYRSRHLLDEDQAVRGANLSTLYRDAGMTDLSRREAIDAVNSDYANYSAHLFLANSYNELRDPSQVELRYETPWFNEFLLANLLAPAAAGTFSQSVSAQEYSRLFARDRLGLVSLTEYSSNGDWVQNLVQHGVYGNFAYAVEADYRRSNGQRPNNELEQRTYALNLKYDLTAKDSLFLRVVSYDAEGGDLGRVYDAGDPAYIRRTFRFEEKQEPLLALGYHREWSPGQHSLVLAGRLHDRLTASDPAQPILLVYKDADSDILGTVGTSVHQRYRSELEVYNLELQHIAQFARWTFIGGARAQIGDIETAGRQWELRDQGPALPEPLIQHVNSDFSRLTGYGYGQWRMIDSITLFAGLSYDYLQFPANHRFAPVSDDEETRTQWSPKAGLTWKLTPASTIRAAYTRSLSGASLDQSYRLEPSQVAGINQSWRGLIPESLVGAQAGARLDSSALEWDYRRTGGTYLAVRGEFNWSDLRREVGVFDIVDTALPSSTTEDLEYQEAALVITLNQLVGKNGALGAQYRLSNAQLRDVFPLIPESVPHEFPPYELKPRQDLESTLHQVRLFGVVNYASGLFGKAEALWFSQSNHGYEPGRPGDSFWQFNLFAGYRLPNRRAEFQLGLVNVADQDYRLNPLNLAPDLPRERAFVASVKLSF